MYFSIDRSLLKSLHLDRDPWNDATPDSKLVERFLTKLDRSASEPNREQNFHFHPSSRPQLFIFSSLPLPLHVCVEKICIPILYRPFHTFRIQIIFRHNYDHTKILRYQIYDIKYRSLSRYTIFLKRGQQISWTREIELFTERGK